MQASLASPGYRGTGQGSPDGASSPAGVCVDHALPGRVRLAHPAWRQADLARSVAYTLRTLPGVLDAEVNPLTGRALVRTRPDLPPQRVAQMAFELTQSLLPAHRRPLEAARGPGSPGLAPLSRSDRRTARMLALTGAALAYTTARWLLGTRGRLALDPRVMLLSWTITILRNHKLIRLAAQTVPGVAWVTGDDVLNVASTLTNAVRESTSALAVQAVAEHARWMSGRAGAGAGRVRPGATAWGRLAEIYARRSTLVGLGAAALAWFLGGGRLGAVAALLVTSPRPVRIAVHRVQARWTEGSVRRGWTPARAGVAERLARVDALVIQWEQVATAGRYEVVEVVPFGEASPSDVLRIAAAAARILGGSEPEREALERACETHAVTPPEPESAERFGAGVTLRVGGKTFLVGEESFVRVRHVRTRHARPTAWRLREMGWRVVYVASSEALLGLVAMGDPVRPEVDRLVETLRALDVQPLAVLTRRRDLKPAPAMGEVIDLDEPAGPQRLGQLVSGRRVMVVADGAVLRSLEPLLRDAADCVGIRVEPQPTERSSGAGEPGVDVCGSVDALPYLAWVVVAARVGQEVVHQVVTASAAVVVSSSLLAATGQVSPSQATRINQWLSLASAVNEIRVGALLDRHPTPPEVGNPGSGFGQASPLRGAADTDPGWPGDGWDGSLATMEAAAAGLSEAQVHERLARFGPNLVDAGRAPSAWRLVGRYLADPLTLTLVGASVLAAAGGAWLDAVAVLAVVTANAAIGTLIERHTGRILEHIHGLAAPRARVLRDGQERVVAASSLVPGDVVLLETGDRIPADGQLIEAYGLEVNEAPLTGESVPVPKEASAALAPQVDARCQVWMGTTVVRGRGRMVVRRTGGQTQLASIMRLASAAPEEATPLQRRLAEAAHTMAAYSLGVGALVGLAGLARGQPLRAMANVALSMAVAAVPEGLPLLATVALARAAARLSPRRVLVRRLAALETLGRVSVICMDKTGTLTYNRLEVVRFVPAAELGAAPGLPPELDLGTCSALEPPGDEVAGRGSGNGVLVAAALAGEGEDAIEHALARFARDAGLDPKSLWSLYPRSDELPFDPELGFSATLRHTGQGPVWFVKGSAERIARRCTGLSAEALDRLERAVRELASQQLRVIALAVAWGPEPPGRREDLHLVGIVGMADPVRPEARPFVRACATAGIRVLMLTGDHEETARRVAQAVGIPADASLTGEEIDALSDDRLVSVVQTTSVYARLRPGHKARLVRALQSAGHVVAMAGDGANDAPALRAADVSMAIGGGASLAEDAAQLVLLDGELSSIAAALQEGTLLRRRIQRALQFLLAGNWGEVTLVGGSLALQGQAAMAPPQILLLNMLTDVLPAMAMVVDDPPERPAGRRRSARRDGRSAAVAEASGPPALVPPKAGGALLEPDEVRQALAAGTWGGLAAWAAWSAARRSPALPPQADQSVAMMAIVAAQLAQMDRWMPHAYRGRWTALAALSTVGSLAVSMLVPPLSRLFSLPWPGTSGWVLAIAAGMAARAWFWLERGGSR